MKCTRLFVVCLLFHCHLFFRIREQWSYEKSLLEAAVETMSSGSEAVLFFRENGFIMELSRRANCELCVSELFQGESDKAAKFYDGSIVLGQFCSLTLGRWTCDWRSQVLYPSRCTVECDLGQVVHTHRPAPWKLRPYGAI